VRGTSIASQVVDGVLTITLSSPDGMNVLGVDTRKKIMAYLKARESDESVRVVVFASQRKAFSAGADLNHLLTLDPRGARAYSKFVRAFLGYVEGYPKPTIGLVDGLAVGGGLELLMVLDMVLATPRARFGQTELNIGLIPGGGGSQRLQRLVGVRKAKEMIYTGDTISAEEALELGLVNGIFDGNMLQSEAAKVIEKIKSKSPRSLSLAKRAINRGLSTDLQSGLRMERELYARVLASRDAKERIRLFLQSRGK
jgi:enoyl-CoA hydratase